MAKTQDVIIEKLRFIGDEQYIQDIDVKLFYIKISEYQNFQITLAFSITKFQISQKMLFFTHLTSIILET